MRERLTLRFHKQAPKMFGNEMFDEHFVQQISDCSGDALYEIELRHCVFQSQNVAEMLADCLGGCANLRSVVLAKNHRFPLAALTRFKAMEKLRISTTGFETPEVDGLRAVLESCKNLEELRLDQKEVCLELDTIALSSALRRSCVRTLHLTNYRFAVSHSLADLFATALKSLELHLCHFSREAVVIGASELEKNKSLLEFGIDGKSFDDAASQAMTAAMCQNTTVKVLRGQLWRGIGVVLSKSRSIKEIAFYGDGQMMEDLANGIAVNQSVKSLTTVLYRSGVYILANAVGVNHSLRKLLVQTFRSEMFELQSLLWSRNGMLEIMGEICDSKTSRLAARNLQMHTQAKLAAQAFLMCWMRREDDWSVRCVDKSIAKKIAACVWKTRGDFVWDFEKKTFEEYE